jgi:hypothetical protein
MQLYTKLLVPTLLDPKRVIASLTEYLIAHVVLPDEVPEELLIHAGFVDDLDELSELMIWGKPREMWTYRSIPKSTAQLQGFQQHRLRLSQGEIGSETETNAHCSESRHGDLDISKLLGENHDCGSCRFR